MEVTMKDESRKRVALKVGAVFTAGLLLFIVQFGAGRLSDLLFFFIMPLTTSNPFGGDGVLVVWYVLAVLMLVSVGVCIWARRLLWISYILVGAYWLWTYVFMTLSI
jgi:hypothetical protein